MELLRDNVPDSTIVRLINSEDKSSSLVTLREVREQAKSSDLDVIMLSKNANGYIVQIGDYSKIIFDKKKKEKENLKKQHANDMDVKEIRISPGIAEHDLKTKGKSIDKFLLHNDKVILSIRYRGRMRERVAEGKEQLQRLLDYVTVPYNESKSTIDGDRVVLHIYPKKEIK